MKSENIRVSLSLEGETQNITECEELAKTDDSDITVNMIMIIIFDIEDCLQLFNQNFGIYYYMA